MATKRLKKEHIEVLIKVYLNRGHNKNKEILAEHEISLLNELVEAGYVNIINKSYSYLSNESSFIEDVIENFTKNVHNMFEFGYYVGRSSKVQKSNKI